MNKYRRCVGSLPILFSMLMDTILNSLNISRPHPLTCLVIDLLGPSLENAPTAHVKKVDESEQVMNRVKSKRSIVLE